MTEIDTLPCLTRVMGGGGAVGSVKFSSASAAVTREKRSASAIISSSNKKRRSLAIEGENEKSVKVCNVHVFENTPTQPHKHSKNPGYADSSANSCDPRFLLEIVTSLSCAPATVVLKKDLRMLFTSLVRMVLVPR